MSVTHRAGKNMRFEEADMLSGILVEYAGRLAHEIQLSTDVNTEEYQRKVKRLLLVKQQLGELSKSFPDLILPAFTSSGTGQKYYVDTVAHEIPYNEPYITVEPIEGDEFITRQVPAGVHVAVTYEEGFITQLITRGTGLEGEDVLPVAYRIPSLPLRLPTLAHYKLIIQGIVGVYRKSYEALPEPRSSVRNQVAGILRTHTTESSTDLDQLVFVAVDIFGPDLSPLHYVETQKLLTELGFTIGVSPEEKSEYVSDGVSYTLNRLKEKRQDLDSSIVIRYLQR